MRRTLALAFAVLALVTVQYRPALAQSDNSSVIAQIRAQIAALMAQLQALQAGQQNATWCHTFYSNLRIGDRGNEVSELETVFAKEDLIRGKFAANGQGVFRTVFDEDMAAAAVAFQQKYGIVATGYVGPLTRARVNKLYGCGAPQDNQQVGTTSPLPVPAPSAGVQAYSNQYMSIKVPSDWIVKEVNQTITDQTYNKATGVATINGTHVVKTGAVNLFKGNYILYINPNASQASGIIGGRFGEIAGGAPSVGAVVKDITFLPCGTKTQQPPTNPSGFNRYDFSVSATSDASQCNIPSDGRSAWYFSYMSKDGGYFNTYNNGSASQVYSDGNNAELVITMAYQSTDVNQLPSVDSAEVQEMLNKMTNIVGTLSLKAWGYVPGATVPTTQG